MDEPHKHGGNRTKIVADANHEPRVMTPEGAEHRMVSYGGMKLAQFTLAAGI